MKQRLVFHLVAHPTHPNTPNQSTFWPIMMPRLVYQTLFPMQNPRLSFKARFSNNNTITSFQDFFLTLRRWFGAADIHFHGLLHTGPLFEFVYICYKIVGLSWQKNCALYMEHSWQNPRAKVGWVGQGLLCLYLEWRQINVHLLVFLADFKTVFFHIWSFTTTLMSVFTQPFYRRGQDEKKEVTFIDEW